MRTLLAAALLLCAIPCAHAETEADRWNLGDLYPTTAAWNADADKLTSQFGEFAACKGHLGDSAARFKECMALRDDMRKRYYRMAVYSGELLAADHSVASSLELDQRGDVLGNKLSQAVSFVDPEVLALGKARV